MENPIDMKSFVYLYFVWIIRKLRYSSRSLQRLTNKKEFIKEVNKGLSDLFVGPGHCQAFENKGFDGDARLHVTNTIPGHFGRVSEPGRLHGLTEAITSCLALQQAQTVRNQVHYQQYLLVYLGNHAVSC